MSTLPTLKNHGKTPLNAIAIDARTSLSVGVFNLGIASIEAVGNEFVGVENFLSGGSSFSWTISVSKIVRYCTFKSQMGKYSLMECF